MKLKHAYSRHARKTRGALFRALFPDAMNQSILDLGGGDGAGRRIADVLGRIDLERMVAPKLITY